MKKFSNKEIILFSLIITGIILSIPLYISVFTSFTLHWLYLTLIFTFYATILIVTFSSSWVFLKRIRSMKELDRLESIFLASVSHELRTPLTSILGFTRMMLKGQVGEINEEQRKALKIILNSANNLHELIDDAIDVNKIEANKLAIRKGKYNLVEEILILKETFEIAADKKGLELVIDTPEHLRIYNDKNRINQILVNLIGNAIKFTEEGKISVIIQRSNGNVEVSVKDTGPGIKKEDLEKLFKPFSRIIVPGKFKEGTGLGLYLSQKLANLLGGELIVESEFGKGSTFKLSLELDEEIM
ncbi:MAG: sensor histidine kinase [Promethearchaeota archaeon]